MNWTRTQKIEYVAKELGITPRAVYGRMKRKEIALDSFNFPDVPADTVLDRDPAAASAVIPAAEIQKILIEHGRLQERLEMVTAHRDALQREVLLLKAPPAELQEAAVTVTWWSWLVGGRRIVTGPIPDGKG